MIECHKIERFACMKWNLVYVRYDAHVKFLLFHNLSAIRKKFLDLSLVAAKFARTFAKTFYKE